MIALASLPPWNDLGSHAGVRPDYRNGGRAGVSAQEASGPATRQLRNRCPSPAQGSSRRPCFPATAGRMRLFPGLPSSEGRRRRHRTVGASLDFAHQRGPA